MRALGAFAWALSMLCAATAATTARTIVRAEVPVGYAPAPLTDSSTWVTTEDYPARAIHDMVEGVTSAELTVDAGGFVSGCLVTKTSGSELLDQTTCSLLIARARFRPRPVAQGSGHWTQRVRWELPKTPAVELKPTSFALQFDVDEEGKPSRCTAQGNVPQPQPDGDVCDQMVRMVRFTPKSGADGKPVRRRVLQTFSLQVTDLPSEPAPVPAAKRGAPAN